MSLLAEAFTSCTMIDKTTVKDGLGGIATLWVDGAKFEAAFDYNNSIQGMTAQAAGVTALYMVTTSKNINLQFHDVFRRDSDGKIFRVKTDGDDVKTPKSAGLDMRQVRAEEYTPPIN